MVCKGLGHFKNVIMYGTSEGIRMLFRFLKATGHFARITSYSRTTVKIIGETDVRSCGGQ